MDVSTVKGYIQTKSIPSFLIFSGTEWVVQKIYINKIAEVMDLQVKYVDSIADIYGTLQSRQFISKSSLYVIRDDKELLTNEKVQEQIDNGLLKSNYLILLLTNPDKRTKFYKQYKDSIVEFEPLKPEILKKYIQKEIPLSDSNCAKLMDICEYDYGRCLLEIDKIKQYRKGHGESEIFDNDSFNLLLKDGAIYVPPKDAIFDLVDVILDRKVSCFDLYEQCKEVNESNLAILSVLYNNAKAVLQVQTCTNTDISKSTGLTGWQISNAKKHLNKYRTGELVNLMRLIRKCEKGIKTGTIEEMYTVDYIMVNTL